MYVIAFKDDAFVMVRHRRRRWEMPGGWLLENESYEECAVREFSEETGIELHVVGEIPTRVPGGKVFVGLAGEALDRPLSREIADVGTFKTLPDALSFPREEYRSMLAQARNMLETFKKREGIGRSASPLTRKDRSR